MHLYVNYMLVVTFISLDESSKNIPITIKAILESCFKWLSKAIHNCKNNIRFLSI